MGARRSMHKWFAAVVVVALTLTASAQDRAAARHRAAAVAVHRARPVDVARLLVRRPATGSKWAAGGLALTTPRNPERDSSSSRWARAAARRRARR